MKIALISDGIPPYVIGGMQQHSASLGVELVKSGQIVDLFHFVFDGHQIPDVNQVNNFYFNGNEGFNNIFCCFFPVSFKFPGHYLFNSYRYSKWVFNIIISNKYEYDFIYCQGFTGWYLLKKRKINNFNIGVNFHGYEMFQRPTDFSSKIEQSFLKPFVKLLSKRADYVFSLGPGITKIIESIGVEKKRIIEIYNGIERNWINKSEISLGKDFKFIFIGREEKRKGISILNSTIINLFKTSLNLEFHFVGDINKKITSNYRNIKIIYHGLITNDEKKKKIIDNCDVLICPSFSEGMPTVIIEAMSRGLAIISSDVGAISSLVSPLNGIILKENNEKNLTNSVKKICSNRDELIRMKTKSKEIILKDFLWDILVEKFISSINIDQRNQVSSI